MSAILDLLTEMRAKSGDAQTIGLSNEIISEFAAHDTDIVQAITDAHAMQAELDQSEISMAEKDLILHLQDSYVNFYSAATINPYVAIAAKGPWIVTSHGAVLHDNGGYGMLGAGHGPDVVIDAMSKIT